MRIEKTNSNLSFQRRLTPIELKQCSGAISDGLRLLNKEVDVIIHSSCMPARAGENTGIGSLFTKGSRKVSGFLKSMGITGIQAEPDGLRKGLEGSPYVSDTFAKNVLMIPLERLKSSEYGNILSAKTFGEIVSARPNAAANRVDYNYVIPKYNEAISEAYQTFKAKSANIAGIPKSEQKAIQKIMNEFAQFKAEKAEKLEKNSLYKILTDIHGNDYYKNWPQADRDLFLPQNAQYATGRIKELKAQNAEKIDEFLFSQMLIDKARKHSSKFNSKFGIKTIADSQVAFSSIDVWANPTCFKEGWALGCPPDYFSKTGQAWGFPVLDPAKMFNQDGSLGDSGKLLFDKFHTMFSDNKGGVRIDHMIGQIDPFVYPEGKLPSDEFAGRLFSSPHHPELHKFAKNTTEEYANIVENIIMKAAKKAGVDTSNIICEDLGVLTKPTENVMKKYNLRGIRITQYADGADDAMHRGKNVADNYIVMVGSHDNPSLVEFTDGKFASNAQYADARYLAEDILPKDMPYHQKAQEEGKIANSKTEYMKAKFAELFTSPAKKVQVFFTDLLGMPETYNKPGTTGSQNWSLRMPDNFVDFYHNSVQNNVGLNMPEILGVAIKQKGANVVSENQKLVNELDKFAKILKEKE